MREEKTCPLWIGVRFEARSSVPSDYSFFWKLDPKISEILSKFLKYFEKICMFNVHQKFLL